MKINYALTLLSLGALTSILFLSGCDGECCQDVNQEPAALIKPDAKIIYSLNGVEKTLQNNETITCEAGDPDIILKPGSTDSDGNVVENNWEIGGQPAQPNADGFIVVECPNPGESQKICLVAKDNDDQNDQTCITLKAAQAEPAQPKTTPPASVLNKGSDTGDGINLDCSDVHDTDSVHTYPDDTYPYGSNTPKDIKEVTWKYTYYYDYSGETVADGPHEKTQTEYNNENGLPEGTCYKWFHKVDDATGEDIKTLKIELTTLDDDHETTTTAYTYHFDTETLTQP